VQSAVLVQITHNNALLGGLAIGSFSADRYRNTIGTLFLTYIGEALNRIIPQFMRG
jgi:uncharacterized protein YigA (DUF484 family)